MPFPYQKAFTLTAVPKEKITGSHSEAEMIRECKADIVEKTIEKFGDSRITVRLLFTKSDRFEFLVTVDEKEGIPWIGKK